MTRLIDGDELRRLAIEDEELFPASYAQLQLSPYELADIIDSMPTINSWNKTVDTLPKDGMLCLVTETNGRVGIRRFYEDDDCVFRWFTTIKAWMPLPKPYKDDE